MKKESHNQKGSHFRCYVAVMLLLTRGDEVLLIRRANTGFGDGLWSLPGGGINGNEPIKQALIRETEEELGITVQDEALNFTTCLHVAPHFRTPNEVLLFCFHATEWSGEIENKEPDKCDSIQFFPLNAIPKEMLEGSALCLKNFVGHCPFSELHWQ